MATKIFRKGLDSLSNGTVFGAIAGVLIVTGRSIYDAIVPRIPENIQILGEYSLPIYIIGIFTVLGYVVDRV